MTSDQNWCNKANNVNLFFLKA